MNENEKLRGLLREARNELGTLDALTLHPNVDSETDGLIQLLRRIDAALAETTSTSPPNWRELKTSAIEQYSLFVSGYELLVHRKGDLWQWKVTPTTAYGWGGVVASLEEAKATALDMVGKRP